MADMRNIIKGGRALLPEFPMHESQLKNPTSQFVCSYFEALVKKLDNSLHATADVEFRNGLEFRSGDWNIDTITILLANLDLIFKEVVPICLDDLLFPANNKKRTMVLLEASLSILASMKTKQHHFQELLTSVIEEKKHCLSLQDSIACITDTIENKRLDNMAKREKVHALRAELRVQEKLVKQKAQEQRRIDEKKAFKEKELEEVEEKLKAKRALLEKLLNDEKAINKKIVSKERYSSVTNSIQTIKLDNQKKLEALHKKAEVLEEDKKIAELFKTNVNDIKKLKFDVGTSDNLNMEIKSLKDTVYKVENKVKLLTEYNEKMQTNIDLKNSEIGDAYDVKNDIKDLDVKIAEAKKIQAENAVIIKEEMKKTEKLEKQDEEVSALLEEYENIPGTVMNMFNRDSGNNNM